MATWPETVPLPRRANYSIEPINPIIQSEMEVGPPKARRFTRIITDTISCVATMTQEQYHLLRQWFYSDSGAAGGAGWFQVELFTGSSSASPETVEARISNGLPTGDHDGDFLTVTLQLKVRYA